MVETLEADQTLTIQSVERFVATVTIAWADSQETSYFHVGTNGRLEGLSGHHRLREQDRRYRRDMPYVLESGNRNQGLPDASCLSGTGMPLNSAARLLPSPLLPTSNQWKRRERPSVRQRGIVKTNQTSISCSIVQQVISLPGVWVA